MNTTSGSGSALVTTRTALSACGTTTTSRPGMWNVSPRAATTSSKMRTWSDTLASHTELRRCEDALQQLIDLADHALGGLVVDRRQRGLDLVQVLELGEQLDVAELAARGQELADEGELAEQVLQAGLRADEA